MRTDEDSLGEVPLPENALYSAGTARTGLCVVPMGGTAIGTGLGAAPGYGEVIARELSEVFGFKQAQAERRSFVDLITNEGLLMEAQIDAVMKSAAAGRSGVHALTQGSPEHGWSVLN
jgi:aspartate ammonia-lyase